MVRLLSHLQQFYPCNTYLLYYEKIITNVFRVRISLVLSSSSFKNPVFPTLINNLWKALLTWCSLLIYSFQGHSWLWRNFHTKFWLYTLVLVSVILTIQSLPHYTTCGILMFDVLKLRIFSLLPYESEGARLLAFFSSLVLGLVWMLLDSYDYVYRFGKLWIININL